MVTVMFFFNIPNSLLSHRCVKDENLAKSEEYELPW